MISTTTRLFAAFFLTATALAGCSTSDTGTSAADEQEVRQRLTDAQLKGKLRGILDEVVFLSEGDYPYAVFEGEAVDPETTSLTVDVVRARLGAAVAAHSDEARDIQDPNCRAEELDVDAAIADGEEAAQADDPDTGEYHDRQLMIALKTMRSQLDGVVGFTFGTNENGDQDEIGTVHYVYVGISRSTGKLIAIMTQAVYT